MRKLAVICFLTAFINYCLSAQSRSELEELRNKNLQEIEYVDKLLKTTLLRKRRKT